MKKQNPFEKLSCREHLRISARAIRLCFRLGKQYTLCLIATSFLSAVIGYIPVYFSAKVIDALCNRAPVEVAVQYVVLTVGLVFLVNLLNTYLSSVKQVSQNAVYRSEDWMWSEKAMEMAYASTEDPEIARQRHRIRKESQTGYNAFFLFECVDNFVSCTTRIVASVSLTISFFVLPAIAILVKLALLFSLALTLLVTMKTATKTTGLDQELWSACVDMNITMEEFIGYIADYSAGKDIRLYGMSEDLADRYLRLDASFYERDVKNSYKKALWAVPGTLLENLFRFGVYGVLLYAAFSGEITVGSIAKYVTCIMLLIGGVQGLVKTLQVAVLNHTSLKRYFAYFDIPNNMYQGTLTVEKRDDNDYTVEFRNVSFRYPNTEVYALRNVNLQFKIGEKLAVVGMNGSGKTTFIKLLCRLYDPTEGEILLNGVDIRKYDYDEYLSIFSVVFQDFRLFPFRLGEVVASGQDYDREKVEECLEKANFGEKFAKFPDGVDTYLYKNYDCSGIEISGGEGQKIALARALYKDAPFILLDEPTAALDPISEYEVYSNFNAIAGEKTAVYISHRLASCRFCDKIAVFDHGEIVQTGTHQRLLADESGKYHELWQAQAQYYVSEETREGTC